MLLWELLATCEHATEPFGMQICVHWSSAKTLVKRNSSFLFGKQPWDRILVPIFEHANPTEKGIEHDVLIRANFFTVEVLNTFLLSQPCDWLLPFSVSRGQSKGAGSCSSSLSLWSSPSCKLPPVRLSGISSVLPYDELSASYGDLKLWRWRNKKKKLPGQANALTAFETLD